MINNVGAQFVQVAAVLLLKLIFSLLTKATKPKSQNSKSGDRKTKELNKI